MTDTGLTKPHLLCMLGLHRYAGWKPCTVEYGSAWPVFENDDRNIPRLRYQRSKAKGQAGTCINCGKIKVTR